MRARLTRLHFARLGSSSGGPCALLGLLAACATAQAPATPRAQAPASGGHDSADLAKQLTNPVASLISVPLQLNYDSDIGPSDGERTQLNVQPVVPIALNEDWNLISRTILPIVGQNDVPTAGDDEYGLGDTTQSFFFSPVAPTSTGWIWGAGPVFLLPTATDATLGAEKWGLGPTAVMLKQEGHWTYGALANHIWTVDGDEARSDVNSTFLQPFVAYTTPEAWTFTLNSESTYDWQADDLAVPLNVLATKVVKSGGQLLSVGGGLRYWIEESDAGPEGWGLRFVVTFLFPK